MRPHTNEEPAPADSAAIALIAPPAPSARYTFAPNESPVLLLRRRPPWAVITSVAVGLLVGALAVFAILSFRKPQTVVVTQPAPSAKPAPPPAPTVRRVVVPLPFLATRVSFDDESRDLDPAADVTAFEVPRESGPRHRVRVTAIDGSRAAGYVRELDGVARVEPEGFTIELPPGPAAPPPAAAAAPPPARVARPATPPVGTVRNGFTKLR
jgi:hypothetical protein